MTAGQIILGACWLALVWVCIVVLVIAREQVRQIEAWRRLKERFGLQ